MEPGNRAGDCINSFVSASSLIELGEGVGSCDDDCRAVWEKRILVLNMRRFLSPASHRGCLSRCASVFQTHSVSLIELSRLLATWLDHQSSHASWM